LRPTFVWHAPAGCAADTFDIQIDNSCPPGQIATCPFPSPEVAASVPASTNRFTPAADLAVQTTVPVGAIYSWRVRACAGASGCGAWSEVGYLNVGRVSNDINGDGYADLIAFSTEQTTFTYRLEIYPGGATPGTTASVHLGGPGVGGITYSAPSFIGDINGDGFTDFLCQQVDRISAGLTPIVFFGGTNLGALSTVSLTSVAAQANHVSVFSDAGDFNGDGFSDIAVDDARSVPTEMMGFYIYLGAAAFADKTPELATAGPLTTGTGLIFQSDTSRTVGDVNGDGFSDVAIFHQASTGTGLARVFFGGSTPDVVGDGDITAMASAPPSDPSGDVDGDGYDDILVTGAGYGLVRGGPALPSFYTPISATGTILLSGFDINGDGRADFLTKDQSGQRVLVLGGATLTSMAGGLAALTGNYLTWADYNSDGRPDFANGDTTAHQVTLLLNDGTLTSTAGSPLPAPSLSPYTLVGSVATGR